MTKSEAIEKVMIENGGTASWSLIYERICDFYPTAKDSKEWSAGIRGVLYREINNKRRFKKIGIGIYALADYIEEEKPSTKDTIRMHSYIEGICVELGNFQNYDTYTADPSAEYRDKLHLGNVTSIHELPMFSYKEIMADARRIDVIWLNHGKLQFPQKVFEVVDSVSTMSDAFNRTLQLQNFNTEFFIVAPEKHHAKYDQILDKVAYCQKRDRFRFINYDNIIKYYETASEANRLETVVFG